MKRRRPIIELSEEDVKRCRTFALSSAPTQQKREFGSDTAPRPDAEVARDTLIGKLGEVAFANFLQYTFDIATQLDFDVYGSGKWDASDLDVNGHRIDVKTARQGARFLMVELNKPEFRKDQRLLPEVFVFAIAGWDRTEDQPTGRVVLEGFATLKEICHPARIGLRDASICEGIEGTQFLPAGQCIPYTSMTLQADNCIRHKRNLHHNWKALVEHITTPCRGSNG